MKIQNKTLQFGFGLLVFLVFCPFVYSDEPPPSEDSSPTTVRDSRTPKYWDMRTYWGFQFSFSPNAFGGQAIHSSQNTSDTTAKPAYAFSLAVDYQPTFIQDYGILGIGPTFELFPIFGSSALPNQFSLLAAGGQIRYQARFFREQPLVPTAAYTVEYFNYRFADGTQGGLVSSGPTLGVWVYLNFLDRESAGQFYVNAGVLRSYIVIEYRNMTGKDPNKGISFTGGSYYFGLRCEI